jgi:DNA repair exonuclease SbcCD ATPase subunit
MSILFFKRVAFVALPVFALGCTESTTSEDVSEARQDVQEEQQDVDELRHETLKPEIDEDLAEDIQEEQQDVTEAQTDLRETEQDFAATQARDSFINEAQASVDAANRRLEELETMKDSQEDAAAETTQKQIDDLEAHRDRLEEAISDMKSADLQQWDTHKSAVETAHQALVNELNASGAADADDVDVFETTPATGVGS